MKNFGRIGVLLSVTVLASCSYFNTNEDLVVTSKDLDPNEVQFQDPYMALNPTRADSVERIIYKDTYGSVAIYDLDVSEEEASRSMGPINPPLNTTTHNGAVHMSESVEVYPIDVSMQNALKP